MSRDVANDGSRFWINDNNGVQPFGPETVGIVDEDAGGVIAYCHEDRADVLVTALRLSAKEEDRLTFTLQAEGPDEFPEGYYRHLARRRMSEETGE